MMLRARARALSLYLSLSLRVERLYTNTDVLLFYVLILVV
jgi:hypothetical protein